MASPMPNKSDKRRFRRKLTESLSTPKLSLSTRNFKYQDKLGPFSDNSFTFEFIGLIGVWARHRHTVD